MFLVYSYLPNENVIKHVVYSVLYAFVADREHSFAAVCRTNTYESCWYTSTDQIESILKRACVSNR